MKPRNNNILGLRSHVLPILKKATNIGLWDEVTVGVATEDETQIIFVGTGEIAEGNRSEERIYDIASLVKLLLHLVCHVIFDGGNPKYAIRGFTPKTRVVDIVSLPFAQYFDQLTIAHLMRFTARFRASTKLGLLAASKFDAVISRIVAEGLEEPPGNVWGYYNHTSLLLGYCLEIVSGKPLHLLMKDCLFDPIGAAEMTFFPRTFWSEEELELRCAKTDTSLALGEVHDPSTRAFLWEGKTTGVAGVFSPVAGLLKVGKMLLRHGLDKDGDTLIPSDRVAGLGKNTLPSGCRTAGGEHVEFGDGAGLLHMFCKGQVYEGEPISVVSPGTIHKLGHPGHVFFHCPVDNVCVVICSDNISKSEMSTSDKRRQVLYPTMTAILAAVLNGIKGYRIAKMRR